MAETTWAAALVPFVDRLGLMFAHAIVIGIVVGIPLFCVVAMFGAKRKQEERRGTLRATRSGARGRALRVLFNPLARWKYRRQLDKFQRSLKAGKGMSL